MPIIVKDGVRRWVAPEDPAARAPRPAAPPTPHAGRVIMDNGVQRWQSHATDPGAHGSRAQKLRVHLEDACRAGNKEHIAQLLTELQRIADGQAPSELVEDT